MKIYIAACFGQQAEVREKAKDIEALGHECTSTWRYETPSGNGSEAEHADKYRGAAATDLFDIGRSNMLVLLAGQVSATGGKHFETGYAVALDKVVIVVGPPENVFHWDLETYPSWETFLLQLGEHSNATRT